MKKNILALGLAAMMLTLPGCVKDTTTDLNGGEGKLVKKTFTVSMELPQNEDGSRLTLDENNAFVWEEYDQITIMGSDGVTYTGTINLQGMGEGRIDEYAEFDVTLPENVTAKYAWRNIAYKTSVSGGSQPHFGNAKGTGGQPAAGDTTLRLGVPGNKLLASTNLATLVNKLPMVGTVDGTNIYMRNIFGFAELRVKGPGRLWSAHIFSTVMSFRGIYGYVSVATEEPVWSMYSTSQNNSSLSPSGMVTCHGESMELTADTATSIFFAVPVSNGTTYTTSYTHKAGELCVILRGDVDDGLDFAVIKSSNKAHTFARNRVTPMSMTFAKPTTGEGATDLTEAGASNCYMVKPSSADAHYKFKSISYDGEPHEGDSYMAVPAWATPNSPITNVWYEGVEAEEGTNAYIHFTVKGGTQNGSLFLARAYASQQQHWNYDTVHIWVTDAEDQSYGGLTVLDRNIGANYMPKSAADVQAMDGAKAAETCGFYYQWGRQTPFPAPLALDGSCSDDNIYGWENKRQYRGGSAYIAYRAMPWSASGFTAYPNTEKNAVNFKDHFMQSMACTGSAYAYQWALDVATSAGGSEATWAYNAKGAQDPCPQGYRVATHDELLKIFRYPTGSGHMKYRHWDVANKKWIYAGTYESAEFTEGDEKPWSQHEYGGYHQSDLTENNFVWVAYSGIRYGNAAGLTTVSADTGSLRWGGYSADARYTDHDANDDKGGRFFIWGVPSVANMTENADLQFLGSPSHPADKRSSYTTTDKMPFAPTLTMRHGGNVYDKDIALALNNALPVRCVKLDTAETSMAITPLSGVAQDANAWE